GGGMARAARHHLGQGQCADRNGAAPDLVMRRFREMLRYPLLGWRLRQIAGDRRSRWMFPYLGATTTLRSRGRILRNPVRVRVRLGPPVREVALKTRTELDVLQEIGLEDEYGPADGVPAKVIVDLGA